MESGDTLRSLGIQISLTGDITNQMTQINKRLETIQKTASTTAVALGGMFAFQQIKNFISEAINFGDQWADQSMRLGLSAVQLQEWSFVAEQAGVSAETVAKGVAKLNQSLGEAQLGKKEAIQNFRELGIDIRKVGGGFKDTNDIIFEVSDKLAKLPTVAQKTAYAARLGGKGFKELGVVLGQGGKILRDQIKLLHDVGGVLSDDLAGKADSFKDKLNAINKSWQVSKTILVMQLLPALTQVATWFSQGLVWLRNFERQTGMVTVAVGALGAAMAVAGLKSIVAWGPTVLAFGLVALELGAIYLFLDDIYHFFKGDKKSMLEDWIKQVYGIEKGTLYVERMRDAFQQMLPFVNALLKPLETINGFFENLREGGKILGHVFGSVIPNKTPYRHTVNPLFPDERFDEKEWDKGYMDRLRSSVLDQRDDYSRAHGYDPKGSAPAFGLLQVHTPLNPFLDQLRMDKTNMARTPLLDLPTPAAPIMNTSTTTSAPTQTNHVTNTFNINGGDPQEVEAKITKVMDKLFTFSTEDFKTVTGQ